MVPEAKFCACGKKLGQVCLNGSSLSLPVCIPYSIHTIPLTQTFRVSILKTGLTPGSLLYALDASPRRQARYGSTPGSIRLDASCGTARRQARYIRLDARLDVDPRSSTQQSMVTGSMPSTPARRQSSMPPRRASIRPRFLDARAQNLSGRGEVGGGGGKGLQECMRLP